jgi:diguanylate cyclase (GGDEF)-like protein
MQLLHAAERDHLTGCHNRRYLNERLMDAAAGPALRREAGLSVILCDIDNFKRINDKHGHSAGDEVIRSFARLLGAATREATDSVIRYGGEEFLLILPGTPIDDAIALAERLRKHFAAASTPSGDGRGRIRTTASFGVAASGPADGRGEASLQDLIDAADKLMYEAKRAGRDCVRAKRLTDRLLPGGDSMQVSG